MSTLFENQGGTTSFSIQTRLPFYYNLKGQNTLFENTLKLSPEKDIKLERSHRSLMSKPKDSTAPPQSIIVRFFDATLKDAIIKQAWSHGQVFFQIKRIFFDQDYSSDLLKKQVTVHEVTKQLKKKGVQAKCLYRAQLWVKLSTGEKTFATLTGAAMLLTELGIEVHCREKELIEKELKEGRRSGTKRKRDMVLPTSDLKALLQEGDETNSKD